MMDVRHRCPAPDVVPRSTGGRSQPTPVIQRHPRIAQGGSGMGNSLITSSSDVKSYDRYVTGLDSPC